MASLLQNGGNVNMPIDVAVKQLQADVTRLVGDFADMKQAIEVVPHLMADFDERLKHIIDQNDVIVQWATSDEDPGAWHAALAGISALVTRVEKVEAATSAAADRLDVLTHALAAHDTRVDARVLAAAEGQAKDIHRIATRQLALGIGMAFLLVAMAVHAYAVKAQFDAAAIWTALGIAFGYIVRWR